MDLQAHHLFELMNYGAIINSISIDLPLLMCSSAEKMIMQEQYIGSPNIVEQDHQNSSELCVDNKPPVRDLKQTSKVIE